MNPFKQFRLIWMLAFVACYSTVLAGTARSMASGYINCVMTLPVLIACYVSFEYEADDEWAIVICVLATAASSVVFTFVSQAFYWSEVGLETAMKDVVPLVVVASGLGLLVTPYTLFSFFVISLMCKS